LRGLTSRAVGEKSQKVTRGSHRNEVSPLTQGLRYRAACDGLWPYLNILHFIVQHYFYLF